MNKAYDKMFADFKESSDNFLKELAIFFDLGEDFKFTNKKVKIVKDFDVSELKKICENSKNTRTYFLQKLKEFEPYNTVSGKSINENWEEDVLLATFDIKL